MGESDLLQLVADYEGETKQIKDEIFRLTWYMRGGVSSEDLFWKYSVEDREIINKVIKDNIEATNKSGLPLI